MLYISVIFTDLGDEYKYCSLHSSHPDTPLEPGWRGDIGGLQGQDTGHRPGTLGQEQPALGGTGTSHKEENYSSID